MFMTTDAVDLFDCRCNSSPILAHLFKIIIPHNQPFQLKYLLNLELMSVLILYYLRFYRNIRFQNSFLNPMPINS